MGQGLFFMVTMSFFFSSTCSRILTSSSSDRDSPLEILEAKEVDLGAEPWQMQSQKGAHWFWTEKEFTGKMVRQTP